MGGNRATSDETNCGMTQENKNMRLCGTDPYPVGGPTGKMVGQKTAKRKGCQQQRACYIQIEHDETRT
jgi:ribulose 1,5-bisphosphate carboxylase large subunit-like protein